MNKYHKNHYTKDPVYHLGARAMKYNSANEMRLLRKKLEHELDLKKPGYILTDSVAIAWTGEIRKDRTHPFLKFIHRIVWMLTPPESDIWRNWVLYRTRKEST